MEAHRLKNEKRAKKEVKGKAIQKAPSPVEPIEKAPGVASKTLGYLFPTDKNIVDIFPIKKVEDDGTIVNADGTFRVYLKIMSFDLNSLPQDVFERLVYRFDYLNGVYLDPTKIITMFFPIDVSDAIAHAMRNVEKAELELAMNVDYNEERRLDWNLTLAREFLERQKLISNNHDDKVFIYSIDAASKKELKSRVNQLIQASGELKLDPLSKSETVKIIKRLFNMNSIL